MNAADRQLQPWIAAVEAESVRLEPDLVRFRRHLHTYPELSLQEFNTSRFIAGVLRDEGLSSTILKQQCGVVCDFDSLYDNDSSTKRKRIGMRGDIDALPIQTNLQCTYSSQNPGVMHACGHDAHTTMALGATLLLARLGKQGQLPWPVSTRTLFQPAEEIARVA